jgi:hypothetical protein
MSDRERHPRVGTKLRNGAHVAENAIDDSRNDIVEEYLLEALWPLSDGLELIRLRVE